MNIRTILIAGLLLLTGIAILPAQTKSETPKSLSGIYPQLAYYNNEGECGTGAVVPWADRLWVVTYGPHLPFGSSDKLYEITPDMREITRRESIGGTPANRMIHRESNQLFIGPYVIDANRNIRTIPNSVMPGRLTGNARHLTDPANKIYYATMEEGFYEVDVHSLKVKMLYPDGNRKATQNQTWVNPVNDLLPGVHGKGLYSGQGKLFYTNNGEGTEEALHKFDVVAGVLAEWNGKDWTTVRRNQFVEVTGPGGIFGNQHPASDPIWTTGWDYKSLLVGVRDADKGWSFYRLPKASHSYDGAHGWNTEWPRIRNVGKEDNPDYLMTMHGMFWHFPADFTYGHTAGIRPRSAYLKVIGDFAQWQNSLVFGCDDSAQNEFLNKRKAKGNIHGPGQSNSNLWFTSLSKPDELGPATAEGAVWAKEEIRADSWSEPFLFAGWEERCCWIHNDADEPVSFSFEVDQEGNRQWRSLRTIAVDPHQDAFLPFSNSDKGEWIRVKTDRNTHGTVSFNYTTPDRRSFKPDEMFKGLADVKEMHCSGGLLYGLGDDRRALGILSNCLENGRRTENGYYEMDDNLQLVRKDNSKMAETIRTNFAIPKDVITIESSSVLVVDDKGRRWRLPLGNKTFNRPTEQGLLRISREVATERDLFQCLGTFYELPAENADGFAKIRPIATHHYQINDYASYRGMLIMTGITPDKTNCNPHIIISADGKAAVWAGVIDDLWQMGKPVGEGGPWKESFAKKEVPSDPYLFGFYDRKSLTLSHDAKESVNFNIEFDPTGNGDWMTWQTIMVKPGKSYRLTFPKAMAARWVRFTSDRDVKATAWLSYR